MYNWITLLYTLLLITILKYKINVKSKKWKEFHVLENFLLLDSEGNPQLRKENAEPREL